ncbi:hypothetical protein AB6846_17740 [Serratia proteamaculans]
MPADWLCCRGFIAGIGLGITNTPVTNTTTGSVSNARAGMASGIDMSARMIALAVNIAVMGFILLAGVDVCLRQTLPESFGTLPLRSVAEQIVAGNLTALKTLPDGMPGPLGSCCVDAKFWPGDVVRRPRCLGVGCGQPDDFRPGKLQPHSR